jgi:hypothetical protein
VKLPFEITTKGGTFWQATEVEGEFLLVTVQNELGTSEKSIPLAFLDAYGQAKEAAC